MVGLRRRVSYQAWMELREEHRPVGSTKTDYRPTKDELRWMVSELVRVGLVEKLPTKRRTDPMVFRLSLATSDLIRLNEEPQQSPIGATPEHKPVLAVVSDSKNPKGTPQEEPHTSEAPNTTNSFTSVKLSSTLRCPHAALLELWGEVMPGSVRRPQASRWKGKRPGYKALAARWKEGFETKTSKGVLLYTDQASGLGWWRRYFVYLTKSNFLMNESRQFDLDWVLKSDNFRKSIEGNWHDK